ncbi:hypothetical protein [Streptomyces sp. ID38640]|uniref:hypothetical protein n=1 Tax=Streptomyces sp. ID38640 TaxID=1265399 RepID=UPI002180A0E8|nr:hypothetical protein [Streptomyces sp. ID38640]
MRMELSSSPWQELEQAQWLCRLPASASQDPRGVAVQLLDATILAQAPGRRDRARAADWALRLTSHPVLRDVPTIGPLVALALAAHLAPRSARGFLEADRLAHVCALTSVALAEVLDRLVVAGAAMSWAYDAATEDLTWTLPSMLAGPQWRVSVR